MKVKKWRRKQTENSRIHHAYIKCAIALLNSDILSEGQVSIMDFHNSFKPEILEHIQSVTHATNRVGRSPIGGAPGKQQEQQKRTKPQAYRLAHRMVFGA
jgi:hypothetical protein